MYSKKILVLDSYWGFFILMTKSEQLLKKGVEVDEPIKILHIDPDYKITYFINRPGSLNLFSHSSQGGYHILKNRKIRFDSFRTA